MQFQIIALLSLTGALANIEAIANTQVDMSNEQGMWSKQIAERFIKSDCNTVCASAAPSPQTDCPCELITQVMNNNNNNNTSSPSEDSVANVLSSVLGNKVSPTPTMPVQLIPASGISMPSVSMSSTPLLDIKPTGVVVPSGEDHSQMTMGDKKAHHKWFTVSDASMYSSKLLAKPSSLSNNNYMASKSTSAAAPSMAIPSSIAYPSKPSSMSRSQNASKSSDSSRIVGKLSAISFIYVFVLLI